MKILRARRFDYLEYTLVVISLILPATPAQGPDGKNPQLPHVALGSDFSS